MFSRAPQKDIDIDLTAFGLPNPRENTLSALKKRAETTHTPPSGGVGGQPGAGTGSEAVKGPVRTAVPPKAALGAALDDLAGVSRPGGPGAGSRAPPGGPSADLDSLLGNLASLAPPSGPRHGTQPTRCVRLCTRYPAAGGATCRQLLPWWWEATRAPASVPPVSCVRPALTLALPGRPQPQHARAPVRGGDTAARRQRRLSPRLRLFR